MFEIAVSVIAILIAVAVPGRWVGVGVEVLVAVGELVAVGTKVAVELGTIVGVNVIVGVKVAVGNEAIYTSLTEVIDKHD